MTSKEKIDFIIESNPYYLTQWENEFIDSVQIQTNSGKELSWKQYKCLNRIFEKVQDREG
jgi:hypothetical protein